KISDTPAKIANPGTKQLWRVYHRRGTATADVLALATDDPEQRPLRLVHPTQPGVERTLQAADVDQVEDLHVRYLDRGSPVTDPGDVHAASERRRADLDRLDPG